jgi:hypothetical protein
LVNNLCPDGLLVRPNYGPWCSRRAVRRLESHAEHLAPRRRQPPCASPSPPAVRLAGSSRRAPRWLQPLAALLRATPRRRSSLCATVRGPRRRPWLSAMLGGLRHSPPPIVPCGGIRCNSRCSPSFFMCRWIPRKGQALVCSSGHSDVQTRQCM